VPTDLRDEVDGIEIQIPPRAEYVALVRLLVSSMATSRRALSDERIDDLKLAVSEACTNAIEAHRSSSSSDERVIVQCIEGDDRLEIVVADSGSGFDPEALPEHPPVTDPTRLNFERGLGIPLIRTLVDEVQFDPSASGTTVTLSIFCGPASEEI
jgi:serine/threonine-protein kinase RsbW